MNLTKQELELLLVWYNAFAASAPGAVPLSDKLKLKLEEKLINYNQLPTPEDYFNSIIEKTKE